VQATATASIGRRLSAIVLVVLVGLSITWAGVAQAGDEPSAESKRLFEEGRAALEHEDFALACQRFTESQQADPRVGTLLNLALCYEKRAMLVQALEAWRGALALATEQNDSRADVARRRADEMLPRVPLLTITLEPGAPPETVVRWTDSYQVEPKDLTAADLGKPFQVNAGTVRLHVEATGRQPRTHELAMAEYDRTKFVVALGAPIEAAPAALAPPPAKPPPSPAPAPDSSAGTSPWFVTGIVVGSVGIVGLGLGGVFGGLAMSKQSESEQGDGQDPALCDAQSVCGQEGYDLRNDAIGMATASTVAFVLGGTLTAAGVVLVLVAPDETDGPAADHGVSSARLAVQPGGVALELGF
jgi:hypothetical protein